MRGASLTVHTQARAPGPALADAPEADLVRGMGAAGPAVRDEEGDQVRRWGQCGADRAGLVVAEAYGPARGASVQVIILDCCYHMSTNAGTPSTRRPLETCARNN